MSDIEQEAQFLIERLRAFESENMDEQSFRDWNGHVSPSIARLEQMLKAARAQGAEPVGFIPSSGLNNLDAGHPARIYPMSAAPSPFESHSLLYTQPQSAGVPEGWKAAALGAKRFAEDPKMVLVQPLTAAAHIRGMADLILSAATTPRAESVPVDMKDLMIAADTLEDYASALDNGDLDGAGHCLPEAVRNMADATNPHRGMQAATPQADGWVKCSEQMPKRGQRVKLFSNDVIQHYMPVLDEGDEGPFWDFEQDVNPAVNFARDQWMPMPQPPREQGGNK